MLLLVLIGVFSLGSKFGLFFAPVIGLGIIVSAGIASFESNIQLREQLRPLLPSRQRIIHYLIKGVGYGLITGSILGFIGSLIFEVMFILIGVTSEGLFGRLSSVINIGLIIGVSGGLIGVMLAFLNYPIVDERPIPGRGVVASLRNAFMMTFFVALFFGAPTWFIIADELVTGIVYLSFILVNALPLAFTWFGGLAWCQHWALRFMLARRGWLPWRLAPWLEEMVARGLLRRVGGGYIFIHRSLLEYFASLEGS
ncbi:MAG: hypothetical protein H6652_03290 [Ardenticatenaceae bacterium]|nr:hypothetical protein [Ardenticatenaceae bacterium]MCB8947986.1 hypothetical protein [Ardenticatenaceae bacterium]